MDRLNRLMMMKILLNPLRNSKGSSPAARFSRVAAAVGEGDQAAGPFFVDQTAGDSGADIVAFPHPSILSTDRLPLVIITPPPASA